MSTYNTLAQAIAQEENSQWPNNPGAIEDTAGVPIDFGSPAAGMTALEKKLQFDASGQSSVYDPSMSLSDFEHTYTGGDPNAGNNVASILGVPVTTPLSALSDQSLSNSGTTLQDAQNAVNNAIAGGGNPALSGKATGPMTGTTSAILDWILSSRLVIGLLGVICIAVGLMMFKTTGVVIEKVTKAGVKAAELAA